MEEFLEFLQIAKLFNKEKDPKKYKTIHLVLGNESCDLDSTMSTLALAYLLYKKNYSKEYLVIPILNVEAKYITLRTESCFLLKKHKIEIDSLVFKDQVDYQQLLQAFEVRTSLVDHHVLSEIDKILEKTVVQIFDHRPINTKDICSSDKIEKQNIKTVGSCSTLILKELIESDLPVLFEELGELIYATIIYDTIGLNKEFGKTFEEDIQMAEYLENILKLTYSRKEMFDLLWQVHNDISGFSTKELLYRDLKVVQGVPIPGLPMLVEDYLKREDSSNAIKAFANEYHSSTVVLIGIDASKEVKRDIAIYSTDTQLKDILIQHLKQSEQHFGSDLLLTEAPIKLENIDCFTQGNIKLTRKFILPIINAAVSLYVQK